MLIGTHKTIAKNVYNNLLENKNIKLNYPLFIAGNIAPDFHIDYIKSSHYRSICYDKVKEAIIELSKSKISLNIFSFKAGIICHYLSDFFCYPHEQEWKYLKGNTKKHIQFEKEQHKISNDKIFELDYELKIITLDNGGIDFFINEMLNEYRESIDYLRDVQYAITASYKCIEAMLFNLFNNNIITI